MPSLARSRLLSRNPVDIAAMPKTWSIGLNVDATVVGNAFVVGMVGVVTPAKMATFAIPRMKHNRGRAASSHDEAISS